MLTTCSRLTPPPGIVFRHNCCQFVCRSLFSSYNLVHHPSILAFVVTRLHAMSAPGSPPPSYVQHPQGPQAGPSSQRSAPEAAITSRQNTTSSRAKGFLKLRPWSLASSSRWKHAPTDETSGSVYSQESYAQARGSTISASTSAETLPAMEDGHPTLRNVSDAGSLRVESESGYEWEGESDLREGSVEPDAYSWVDPSLWGSQEGVDLPVSS